jgi:hypothetical protein
MDQMGGALGALWHWKRGATGGSTSDEGRQHCPECRLPVYVLKT